MQSVTISVYRYAILSHLIDYVGTATIHVVIVGYAIYRCIHSPVMKLFVLTWKNNVHLKYISGTQKYIMQAFARSI